ncbi:MAG TPA: glycosyltransferase, partial [Planctomicrobium sp.]|nr:glycosyltransferase [Planctomicrobium sp.]
FTEAYTGRQFRKKRFRAPADLVRQGIPVSYPTYWYTPRCFQNWYGDQMWWSVKKCVQETLKVFKPDAVLSYWAHPDGEVGRRAAELAGIPSAVIVGGTDVLVLPQRHGRGPKIQKVLNQSSAVITVSKGLASKVCEMGVPEMNVVTIYQGVDENLFECVHTRSMSRLKLGLSNDVAHLLWVGRMVEIKAIPVLLNAVALLRDQGVRFQLHLLGDGPQRGSMEQLAAKFNLSEQVQFHGCISQDAIADWYRAADVTVLSSDSEGLPNVLRESLACGTPFVSTNVGSVHELLFPEASCLVLPRDPVAFADAIQKMLTPEAKQAASAYLPTSWNNTARKTARLLNALRGERKDERRTDLLKACVDSELMCGEIPCASPMKEGNT